MVVDGNSDNSISMPGSNYRIALVVTIAGSQKLVDYFEWSCRSLAESSPLIDMLVFHEGNSRIHKITCPKNVHFIDLKENGLSRLIVSHIMEGSSSNNSTLDDVTELLSHVVAHIPRYLVEIKPMTGSLFAKWLRPYSHWSYTDPDIIWGNMADWLDAVEMKKYDVITFSKLSDAGRLFVRGQFALHVNKEKINNMWRRLSYLTPTTFTKRVASASYALREVGEKRQPADAIFAKNFISAEGAYSAVVFGVKGIRVKIVGRGFDDFSRTPVLRIDNGVMHRCDKPVLAIETDTPSDSNKVVQCIRSVVGEGGSDGSAAVVASNNSSATTTSTSSSGLSDLPPTKLVLAVVSSHETVCQMQWLPVEYRLCAVTPGYGGGLKGRGKTDNSKNIRLSRVNEAVLVKGKWHISDETVSSVPSTAAFFHFRHWDDFASSGTEVEWGLGAQGDSSRLDPCMVVCLRKVNTASQGKVRFLSFESCSHALSLSQQANVDTDQSSVDSGQEHSTSEDKHAIHSLANAAKKHRKGKKRQRKAGRGGGGRR
eukprot:gene336-603_t